MALGRVRLAIAVIVCALVIGAALLLLLSDSAVFAAGGLIVYGGSLAFVARRRASVARLAMVMVIYGVGLGASLSLIVDGFVVTGFALYAMNLAFAATGLRALLILFGFLDEDRRVDPGRGVV